MRKRLHKVDAHNLEVIVTVLRTMLLLVASKKQLLPCGSQVFVWFLHPDFN